VVNESVMVVAEAPKEQANVTTLEALAAKATTLELSEEVLQKVAEMEVMTTLEASDELVEKMAEKEGAVVLHEVSQEVVAEKLVNLEVPKETVKKDGATEVSREAAEGVYLGAVAKGSTFNPGEASELESVDRLSQEEILKLHVIEEHARQQKKVAADVRTPSQDTYGIVLELEKSRHLLIGDMEEEQEEDIAFLAVLSELEREKVLDRCYQQHEVDKEMEGLKEDIEE
jgi:hypothetical protein